MTDKKTTPTGTIALIFGVADYLPCRYCGTDTALMQYGRVIGIRHYDDCPMYDPLVRFDCGPYLHGDQ